MIVTESIGTSLMNSMPFEEHLKNDINVTKPQIVINSQTIYVIFLHGCTSVPKVVDVDWLSLSGGNNT